MGTICKINIDSIDVDAFHEVLLAYLKDEYSEEHNQIESEWPLSMEHDRFENGYSVPTIYSYQVIKNHLIECYFNSFFDNEKLALALSKALSAKITVNMYQSTADAGSWLYFENGIKIRHIEFGDGETLEKFGEKLPFENTPLGHDIGDDDDPYFVFSYEDLDDYNEAIGLKVQIYNEMEPGWINIEYKSNNSAKNQKDIKNRKSWWKIW